MSKAITLQRLSGWVFFLPLSLVIIGLVRLRGKYRINNHAEIRRQFLELVKDKKQVIICSNHLTLIDSIILIWAFASTFRYFFNYRLLSWNLPAAENATRHLSWAVITYLNKCILVDRLGDFSHTQEIVDKICEVVKSGDLFTIFPEGTRSRSGRVDPNSVNYGIGKFLQKLPDCEVLCVYLRGRGQDQYSDFPKKGEIFDISMELVKPESKAQTLRGARDLSKQIINKIAEMEVSYFAKRQNETQNA